MTPPGKSPLSERVDAPTAPGTRCGWMKIQTAAWKPMARNGSGASNWPASEA